MSEQFGIPIVFEYSANVYCKFCHSWGTVEDPWSQPCGNCGNKGYMMLNPFPENKIPYIKLEDLREGLRENPAQKEKS